MTPLLAHNPAGLLDAISITFILALILIPLVYTGVCLLAFLLVGIGSGRGLPRAALSATACSVLVFCLFAPAAIWLQPSCGSADSMNEPAWLSCSKVLLLLLMIFTPTAMGRLIAKLSWLRVTLITISVAIVMGGTLALLFALGVFMAVMSQV